jgi:hypothetical protein
MAPRIQALGGGWRSVARKEEAGSNQPDRRQARLNGVARKRHGVAA